GVKFLATDAVTTPAGGTDESQLPFTTEPPPDAIPHTPKLLEKGATVGRYVVLHPLGAGGMGVVYAAYDPELDRRVALKLLHAEVGGTGSVAHARLLREAQAAAKLSHPNVVAVFD